MVEVTLVYNTLQSSSGGRTAFWILITGLGQVLKLLITMASTVVLARLLVPGDFGLMATAGPIMGFVDLLRDAGFSQALVQRKDVTEEQGHGLFWLMMAMTVLLGLVVVATSPIAAAAFNEPRLVGVLTASAVIMQISSFGAQPTAWLNRHMRFNVLTMIDVIASAVSLTVAATIALMFRNYWALVAAGLAGTIATTLLAFFISGWRPGKPHFDRGVLDMARFGAGVSFSNIMNYLSRNSDNLLIAGRFGPAALGYYDRAYKLMLMPLTQITWPVQRVLVPVLSRLQDDRKAYSDTYLTTISYIMVVAQPALLTATVLAKPTILFLLGAKWAPAIPIFQWLSAAAVHQIVTSSHGWLYLSQGRAKHYAIVGAFGSITTVGAFLIGLHWGPLGVAMAYTISDYGLRLPFAWLYVGRSGPVRTGALLRNATPHAVACAVAAAVLIAVRLTDSEGLIALTGGTLLAYASYALVLLMWRDKRRLMSRGVGQLLTKLQQMRLPRVRPV